MRGFPHTVRRRTTLSSVRLQPWWNMRRQTDTWCRRNGPFKTKGQGHPAKAAPPLGRLLMMFAVAFGWIVFLTAVMPWPQLTREEVHSELGKLYKPFMGIIGMSWILV